MNDSPFSEEPPIKFFEGEFEFLSNFYPAAIKWPLPKFVKKEYKYEFFVAASVEHVFQAEKVDRLRTNAANAYMTIITSPTPGKAKSNGRRAALRPDWEDKKYGVMRSAIRLKFMPGSSLAFDLLKTGERDLIEGNSWHDNIWGDCVCGKPKCRETGQNLLGQILMGQRNELLLRGDHPS